MKRFGKFASVCITAAVLCAARFAHAPVLKQVPSDALVVNTVHKLNAVSDQHGAMGQNADLAAIGRTKFDLVVIDYSSDGTAAGRFSAAQIAGLQNGGAKRVLADLTIGEAEDYRFYWQKN